MDSIQLFLSHRADISPFRYKASYPPVGVLHQALFPRMISVGKIDACVEKSFELPPAREGDVVIGGDTSNNNTLQHLRKRSTNSAALSVWQLLHPRTLCIAVHNHQKHPRRQFGYNEVHLEMPETIHDRTIINI